MVKSITIKNMVFIITVAFPILFLLGIISFNEYTLRAGKTVTLPIRIISVKPSSLKFKLLIKSDYIIYSINSYRIHDFCPQSEKSDESPVLEYLCLKPRKKVTLYHPYKNCSVFVKGECKQWWKEYDSFRIDKTPGTQHFYFTTNKTQYQIDQLFLLEEDKKVLLSITKTGRILAKDILIGGKSLKKLVQEP